MVDDKKDEGAGDPIKILLEEALERQRNAMMDSFAQILSATQKWRIGFQQLLWKCHAL